MMTFSRAERRVFCRFKGLAGLSMMNSGLKRRKTASKRVATAQNRAPCRHFVPAGDDITGAARFPGAGRIFENEHRAHFLLYQIVVIFHRRRFGVKLLIFEHRYSI